MIQLMNRRLRKWLRAPALPAAAKAAREEDAKGLRQRDPGVDAVIREGVAWLCRAQDNSRTQDGGVARHFSLIDGWGSSYPETTGYIIPTLLSYARTIKDEAFARHLRDRACRMLQWLTSIQLPCGGFQGGTVDQKPVVPVTFNTGQILMGLAAAVSEFGETYSPVMARTADWLVSTQDSDGCWRKYPSPFDAMPGERVYDAHVAWGLLEADRVHHNPRYRQAALANIHWALESQLPNGWFNNCCLRDRAEPLTHAIGYVLRGVVEAYLVTNDSTLLATAARTADGLLTALGPDGFLSGKLNCNWNGTASWSCLTGTAQIAICWFLLYRCTGEARYREGACRANRYLRRTVSVQGSPDVRGGVKGSFPVGGEYGIYQYLNWGCKFVIDSHLMESSIRSSDAPVECVADERKG